LNQNVVLRILEPYVLDDALTEFAAHRDVEVLSKLPVTRTVAFTDDGVDEVQLLLAEYNRLTPPKS
jgi:hypothetical protein